MGRLAHITRLALGRSPYGPPLRDENGDFILGPHAHDDEAQGYRQEFDDRGHPQNRSSKAAAKRLRKAQNDVLATVGVVVRKGEERKTKWERLEDSQKWDLIYNENSRGGELKAQDRISGVVLPWYFVSLRQRLMTFTPYASLPLTSLIVKEFRLRRPLNFLFGGLPLHMLGSLPLLFRYYVCEPNVEGVVNYINIWRNTEWCDTVPAALKWYSATTIARCIELPLLLHSTLQALQIVPANVTLSMRSFIPFSASSPITYIPLPSPVNRDSLTTFLLTTIQTPLCLYLIRDYLQVEVGYRIYALLRQVLTKPDRPDLISAKVSDENENIEDTSIAGIGYPWPGDDREYERNKRYFGPRSFFGALRIAFPPLYRLLNILSGGRISTSRGRLSTQLEQRLKAATREGYWLAQVDLDEPPKPGSTEAALFQRNVVTSIFRLANMVPSEELVDHNAWAQATLGPETETQRSQANTWQNLNNGSDRPLPSIRPRQGPSNNREQDEAANNVLSEAFRAMRVSDAVFIQASNGQAVISVQPTPGNPSSIAERDNVHTIDAAEIPLEALLQGVSDMEPNTRLIEREEDHLQRRDPHRNIQPHRRPPTPPTPVPGLSRAVSLTDPQAGVPPQPNLRPLRRPTETDDSLAAISQTLRAEAGNLQSPRPSSVTSPITERPSGHPTTIFEAGAIQEIMPTRHRLYRVTTLSNHAADSLAWHASALLTSLILWPFEAIWLRSITNWALQNPAMGQVIDPWWAARLGFGVFGRPLNVLNTSTWFGGAFDRGDRLRYAGNVLLTMGLEGIIRGCCWSVGVWWVKRSKDAYGWGQF